jgi:hypothetical protein
VAALSDTRYSDDKRDCVKIAMPKIHESVFQRIAVDAHLYAPVALPPAYEILTYDENIVPPDTLGYETAASARHREKTQEHVVGSSIWRRRVIYFLTVIASVYLLTYPLTSQLPASDEYTTRLRPLSDVIRMVGLALPGAASRWINAYARDPLSFVLHAGLVALLLWLSASLRSRITDQMRSAWRYSLSKFDVHARHSKPRAGAGVLLKLIWLALLLVALYPMPGWFGYPLPKAPEALQIFIDHITQPYFRFFAIAILITMLLKDSTIAWLRLTDGYKQAITTIKLKIAPGFFALLFLYGGIALASHYIFNVRDSFGAFCKPSGNANGLGICRPNELELCTRGTDGVLPSTCTAACRGVEARFDTANLCTSARVKVSRFQTYQFEISKDDDWTFLGAPSGPGGMPLSAFLPQEQDGWWDSTVALARTAVLFVAYPIKRSFDRPFGRVIIRYGETGNEENFIDANEDLRSVDHLKEKFRATRDGELFVYLNKPVSGFWPDLFGNVNTGTARIRVYRVQN